MTTGIIVHEWIEQSGGSENVLEAMSRVYPEAEIICLWNDSVGRFDPARVSETWLARTPLRRSKAAALLLMPSVWRHLPTRDVDWTLVSTHLFAHHARFAGGPDRRYVYVHTPARYIWNPELDARGASAPVRAAAAALKPLDRRRAREGGDYAANSEFVRQRIRAAWDLDARVIHPPVSVAAIQSQRWSETLQGNDAAALDALPERFVLGASRFIPYKRLDLVVRTGELLDTPVVLAGNGPELERLREVAAGAKVPVHFVISPSRALLWALYETTWLYVFPAVEDFGIMPVEALSAGAAVLAQSLGGASETVREGSSGALASFADEGELVAAAERAVATDRSRRRSEALRFDEARFDREIREWVGE